MGYCTQADIVGRYSDDDIVELADHDRDGTVDAAVVTRAINDASGQIDSYLQKKFVVPIPAPVPAVLCARCVDIAVYRLQLWRRSVTEDIKKAYDDAIQWLKDIVAGKVDIGLTPKPAEAAGAPNVLHDGQPRLFGRDKPL